jgi:hypothetical protein
VLLYHEASPLLAKPVSQPAVVTFCFHGPASVDFVSCEWVCSSRLFA